MKPREWSVRSGARKAWCRCAGKHERVIRMSEPRVIKKYPNRRLYDTIESRYITLADIRRLVVERIDFVVVDKKNNADITRSILLQVIAEQEHLADPILSQEFMVGVIRSYGTPMQGQVSPYLETSLRQLAGQQPMMRE